MAKLVLNNITDLEWPYSAVSLINANNDKIEIALENTLSRNGATPNQMEATLDMNDNSIINLPTPTNNTEAATKAYVDGLIESLTDDDGASESLGVIDVRDFGAIADGAELTPGVIGGSFTGTDNTTFFQNALNAATAQRKTLYVPPGKYRFADGDGVDNLTCNGDWYYIIADGAEFLLDDEGIDGAGSSLTAGNALFGSTETADRDAKSRFYLRGATFRGRWSHFDLEGWDGNAGKRGIIVYGFNEFVLDCVSAFDIRSQFVNSWACNSARVTNGHFERIARACIRINDTPDLIIANNNFKWTNDDVIACVSSTTDQNPTTSVIRGRMNIVNNNFFQCESVLIQGARVLNIIGNHFMLSKSAAIHVGGGVQVPDIVPYAINIIGNTVENTTTAADINLNLVAADEGNAGIVVEGAQLSPVTPAGTDYPGFSNGTTVIDPKGKTGSTYFILGQDAARGAGFGLNVVGNNVHLTQNTGTNYSDLGYGEMFTHWGFINPLMAATNFAENGINITHDVRGVNVANNTITGHRLGAGVFLDFANTTDANKTYRDVLITNNICVDNRRGVSSNREAVGTTRSVEVIAIGNIFDCDPYHVSARRTSPIDGTWQSGTSAADMVSGIQLRGTQGWVIRDCYFANCIETVHGIGALHANSNIQGCMVACDPAATGFSTSNGGVGNVPEAGIGFQHIIRHCNPTDTANFTHLKNICPTAGTAVPATGTFVKGHFVEKSNLAIADGQVLRGWLRLTTGTGHVDGTDWFRVYNLQVD